MVVLRTRDPSGGASHGVNLRTRLTGSKVSTHLPSGTLIHHWPFEEDDADDRIDIIDRVTLIPTGTVTRETGKVGYAFYTEGDVNGNFLKNSQQNLTLLGAPWTWALWTKRNAQTFDGWGWLLNDGDGFTAGIGFWRFIWPHQATPVGTDVPKFQVSTGAAWSSIDHTMNIAASTGWYLCSASFNGSTGWKSRVYCASPSFDEEVSGTITPNSSPAAEFSMHGAATQARVGGWTDELKVWRGELTWEAVKTLMGV